MENEKTVETQNTPKTKSTKPKKKENVAAMNTNLLFSFIILCALCLILIGVGLFLIIGIKTYFGGILLLVWGIVFGGLNIFLNKSLFKKKVSAKEVTKTNE